MIPQDLCDQLQPPCPAGVPILSRLGLEPDYRLLVQDEYYLLDAAGIESLLLSQRPLIGRGGSSSVVLGISLFLVDPLVCVGILGQLDSNLYLLRCRPYEAKTFTSASNATRIAATWFLWS